MESSERRESALKAVGSTAALVLALGAWYALAPEAQEENEPQDSNHQEPSNSPVAIRTNIAPEAEVPQEDAAQITLEQQIARLNIGKTASDCIRAPGDVICSTSRDPKVIECTATQQGGALPVTLIEGEDEWTIRAGAATYNYPIEDNADFICGEVRDMIFTSFEDLDREAICGNMDPKGADCESYLQYLWAASDEASEQVQLMNDLLAELDAQGQDYFQASATLIEIGTLSIAVVPLSPSLENPEGSLVYSIKSNQSSKDLLTSDLDEVLELLSR